MQNVRLFDNNLEYWAVASNKSRFEKLNKNFDLFI